MLNLGRQQAISFLKLQCLAVLLVAIGFLLVSLQYSLAALSGGAICLLANGYFVYKAFRVVGATQAKGIASGFIIGEIGKISITVILMVGAFLYTSLLPLPLLVGFLLTQSVFWVAPFVFRRPQVRKA
jgi:F0F1-type ATP synthase assembly protein I